MRASRPRARARPSPRRLATALACALACALGVGCGAKTGVIDPDAGPGCLDDESCSNGLVCDGAERCVEGRCMRGVPLACDDGDECTVDACEEPRGCAHEGLREDRDRDDYDVILPDGPASCGDDCDDDDPAIHPGATELCNGVDDDCDGLVDEGAAYMPSGDEVRLTADAVASSAGGVAYSPATETWGVTYWDYGSGSADIRFLELGPTGRPVGEPKLVTREPGDAYGMSLLWDGRAYAGAWEDRRDGDFEIYFNRFSPDGEKLAPDYRVSYAAGFSINHSLRWTGREYALAWQDGRHEVEVPDNFEIYLSFLDREGFEIGDELRLTNDPSSSESPSLAVGDGEIGVAFVDNRTGTQQVWFLVVDPAGRVVEPEQLLSAGALRATSPVAVWASGAFVVVWQEQSPLGDADVAGVRIPRAPPAPFEGSSRLVYGASWSRSPAMLSNGDRLVLVWGDDRAGSYDLWLALFDPTLERLTPDVPVTTAAGDGLFASLGRGPESIGVLFRDQRDGNWEVYFTRLLCAE